MLHYQDRMGPDLISLFPIIYTSEPLSGQDRPFPKPGHENENGQIFSYQDSRTEIRSPLTMSTRLGVAAAPITIHIGWPEATARHTGRLLETIYTVITKENK